MRLANRFVFLPVDVIYSSDLKRAYQTAAMVGRKLQVNVETCSMLRERSFGKLEGMTSEEIKKKYSMFPIDPELSGKYGIETMEEMQKRIVTRLEQLMTQYTSKRILVVSHGGVINSFLRYVTKGETEKIKLDNTGISQFSFDNKKWMLHSLNDTRHLSV